MIVLEPVNGQVLVEIPKDDSGVIIPTALSDSTQEGIVISADESLLIFNLKPGDRIRWERYAEADGEFDYTIPNGVDTRKVKAVLIDSKRITGVWRSK